MKFFFFKLLAPRNDFMQTMSADELSLMKEHGKYLQSLMGKGLIAAFGPVANPHEAFGMALATLPDGVDPESLTSNDPTIKANVGFKYEISPMPLLTLKQ
jgi:uncharacterized protein YciI